MVVERGYDQVKVEDIADAAGVSPRTFNNYFSSKAEAVAWRHLTRMLGVTDVLRQRPLDEPLWVALRMAILSVIEPVPQLAGHPQPEHYSWVVGVRAMMAEPVLQAEMLRAGAIGEAAFAAAVAERTGTDLERDLYPRLIAAAVNAATGAATQHFLHADPPQPMEQILAEALSCLAAGLPEPERTS